jgi:anti-sigma factor RsiW
MSDIDLKAYFFGELPEDERRLVKAHLDADPAARAELSRLEATQAMLGFMQDEEMPRRIAFVSDKVFEPTWWQRFFASGAQLGFASAVLLAAAIAGHGWMSRPVALVPVQGSVPVEARIDAAAVREVVAVEVNKRMAEVARQVSAPANSGETAKMIAVALKEAEHKAEMDRAADRLTIEENFNLLRRLISRDQVASYQRPVGN